MYPKSFRPAKRDVLLHQQWNNATSSLRVLILKAASVANWVTIDILSVGSNNEFNNTLLIAVAPESMSWHQGHVLALRCKFILEEHGIKDVHCEIRESVLTFGVDVPVDAPLAASANGSSGTPDTILSDFQLSSAPITGPYEDYHVELSENLGTKITMKDSDSAIGTKGLYLALSPSSGGEPRVVALTCRNTVLSSETEGLQEYRHLESQPSKDVIQVPQPTYNRVLEYLAKAVKRYRYWASRAADRNRPDDVDRMNKTADKLETLKQFMDRYKTPASRVFGHLLYSPELACTSNMNSARWLRNWALIELSPNHHQTQLSTLRNKVFVESLSSFLHIADRAKLSSRADLLVEGDAIFLENAVVPVEELFSPPGDTDDPDTEPLVVVKYDAMDGLTFGLGNTLKSLVRYSDTGREFISEEWCITSATSADEYQVAFSLKDDSGSCLWDRERRVAGILTTGCGNKKVNDVTYAQPMENLLVDIRAHGFDVSLV